MFGIIWVKMHSQALWVLCRCAHFWWARARRDWSCSHGADDCFIDAGTYSVEYAEERRSIQGASTPLYLTTQGFTEVAIDSDSNDVPL